MKYYTRFIMNEEEYSGVIDYHNTDGSHPSSTVEVAELLEMEMDTASEIVVLEVHLLH